MVALDMQGAVDHEDPRVIEEKKVNRDELVEPEGQGVEVEAENQGFRAVEGYRELLGLKDPLAILAAQEEGECVVPTARMEKLEKRDPVDSLVQLELRD